MRPVVMLGVTRLTYFRLRWRILAWCMPIYLNMNDVEKKCAPASRFVDQVHQMMDELKKHHFDGGFTALEYF
jgi:hypothetical protein